MPAGDSELKPFVLRKFAQGHDYQPLNWSLNDLNKWLIENEVSLRSSSLEHQKGKIVFEKMCSTILTTAEDFIHWLKGECVFQGDGEKIDPSTHWVYYDYKPAAQAFAQEFTDALSFDKLGIKGKFNDETVWIGSTGAYTPCHYDSYGYNVHIQLKGTKRWVLFPPETHLGPTRVPYEESTIYSSFDVIGGELPTTGSQKAYVAYLDEGDLLFVPPKWWHSVQCFSASPDSGAVFSVNKWIPLDTDEIERKRECLVGCLSMLINNSYWESDAITKAEIGAALDDCIGTAFAQTTAEDEPAAKKPRIINNLNDTKDAMIGFYQIYTPQAEHLTPISFTQLMDEMNLKRAVPTVEESVVRTIITDPQAIVQSPEYSELPYTPDIRRVINAFTDKSTLDHVMHLMDSNNR